MEQFNKLGKRMLIQEETAKEFLEVMIEYFKWDKFSYYIELKEDGYVCVAWTKTIHYKPNFGSAVECLSEEEAFNKAIIRLIENIYKMHGYDTKVLMKILERNTKKNILKKQKLC